MTGKLAIRMLVLALPFCAGASAATAISNSSLDDPADGANASASVPSTWSEPTTTVVEVAIPPSTPGSFAAERPLSANPLWGMPLKQFTVTRERPIFLPSRRPPPEIVERPPPIASPPPPKVSKVERPQLSLIGTIGSEEESFGIFVDESNKAALRLKIDEDYRGCKLRAVRAREIMLECDRQMTILNLPQAGAPQNQLLPSVGTAAVSNLPGPFPPVAVPMH